MAFLSKAFSWHFCWVILASTKISAISFSNSKYDQEEKAVPWWVFRSSQSQKDSDKDKSDTLTYAIYNPTSSKFEDKLLMSSSSMKNTSTVVESRMGLEGAGGHEERMLLRILNHRRNGYFVDLGANHFHYLSNSYNLEQVLAWTGVCIEANDEYISGLVTNRRCRVVQAAVADRDHPVMKFRMRGVIGGLIGEGEQSQAQLQPQERTKGQRQGQGQDKEGDGLDNKESSLPSSSSSLRGTEVTVHTVTLTQILDHLQTPRHMDLLLIDIEGGEWLALKHFDFEKYHFNVIIVERPIQLLHQLLRDKGYRFLLERGGDCYYLHPIYYPQYQKIVNRFETKTTKRQFKDKGLDKEGGSDRDKEKDQSSERGLEKDKGSAKSTRTRPMAKVIPEWEGRKRAYLLE